MATSPNPSRNPRLMKFAVPIVLVAATVLLFDLAAWFLVPPQYTAFAYSYRKTQLLSGAASGFPAMTRAYPRYYFRADEATGFDMSPGARGVHEFNAVPYPIFANSLGCFDRNELSVFQRAGEYDYFAGDSFTWGFAEYDSKFATVWERLTGKVAAKCGLTHTGQAHQFEKFKRVAAAIGKFPATVFVGFYVNDPANDEAYPHTTVVGGYMVDTAFLKDGAIVHPPVAQVRQVVEDSIRELERPPGVIDRLKTCVWVFSLSANIANEGGLAIGRALRPAPPGSAPNLPGAGERPTSRFGGNLYDWYPGDAMKARYASDPQTSANRAALRRWAEHAREHSYRLVLLLIPPKGDFDDVEYFAQVRGWLDANGIEYLDLAQLFSREKLGRDDLYWRDDAHWSPGGNRIVGRLLATRFPGPRNSPGAR